MPGQRTRLGREAVLEAVVMLNMCGHTEKDIGQIMNIATGSIGNILKSPEAKAAQAEARRKREDMVFDSTIGKAIKASDKMLEIILDLAYNGENDRVRLAAARDVLDRAGMVHQDTSKVENKPFIAVNILNTPRNERHEGETMPTELAGAVNADYTIEGGDSSGSGEDLGQPRALGEWSESQQDPGDGEEDGEGGLGVSADSPERIREEGEDLAEQDDSINPVTTLGEAIRAAD